MPPPLRKLCAAGDKGLAVYPVGGGTTLTAKGDGGGCRRTFWRMEKPLPTTSSVPFPASRFLLAKLNRLIDYPADDMTVTVEAGMTDQPS